MFFLQYSSSCGQTYFKTHNNDDIFTLHVAVEAQAHAGTNNKTRCWTAKRTRKNFNLFLLYLSRRRCNVKQKWQFWTLNKTSKFMVLITCSFVNNNNNQRQPVIIKVSHYDILSKPMSSIPQSTYCINKTCLQQTVQTAFWVFEHRTRSKGAKRWVTDVRMIKLKVESSVIHWSCFSFFKLQCWCLVSLSIQTSITSYIGLGI